MREQFCFCTFVLWQMWNAFPTRVMLIFPACLQQIIIVVLFQGQISLRSSLFFVVFLLTGLMCYIVTWAASNSACIVDSSVSNLGNPTLSNTCMLIINRLNCTFFPLIFHVSAKFAPNYEICTFCHPTFFLHILPPNFLNFAHFVTQFQNKMPNYNIGDIHVQNFENWVA